MATKRAFNFQDLANAKSNQHKNRLLFEWLCDDEDREKLYAELLKKGVATFPSLTQFQDDPSPLLSDNPTQAHHTTYLVADPALIEQILAGNGSNFSNQPYRLLGSGDFMLGMDPNAAKNPQSKWHQMQRRVAGEALGWGPNPRFGTPERANLVKLATQRTLVLPLCQTQFDLARVAEQAALHYCALLFGFAGRDHALLQEAATRGYRALGYINLGRHFVVEPDTLPTARAALARLARRADELMREYRQVEYDPQAPRGPGHPRQTQNDWPAGVEAYDALGLSGLMPVLKHWALNGGEELSSDQLATMAAGLIVGTVGNVQASVCLAMQKLLGQHRTQPPGVVDRHWLNAALADTPPVPFLPRLVMQANTQLGKHHTARDGDEVVLCVGAAQRFVFGQNQAKTATHPCVGQMLATDLVLEVVNTVNKLPGLARPLDPVTLEHLGLERRWGFACERMPLEYNRDQQLVQQPLQVVMRIKTPVAENAAALLRLIRDGASRIEQALRESRHVHFAWFQLIENDTHLVLQTVYDGDFDAYLEHFALRVDDVFDDLFRYLEDAPPLPVRQFPERFIQTLRRFNRAPVGGYFFSAYPLIGVSTIEGLCAASKLPTRNEP